MNKLIGCALLMIAVAGFAFALPGNEGPEIDTGSVAGALTLLGGAMLVIRGRRKN